jgi:hypothetical protein
MKWVVTGSHDAGSQNSGKSCYIYALNTTDKKFTISDRVNFAGDGSWPDIHANADKTSTTLKEFSIHSTRRGAPLRYSIDGADGIVKSLLGRSFPGSKARSQIVVSPTNEGAVRLVPHVR